MRETEQLQRKRLSLAGKIKRRHARIAELEIELTRYERELRWIDDKIRGARLSASRK